MKNKKLFIILSIGILFIILRFILLSSFVPYIRSGYRFDDVLMLNLVNNLSSGHYLGSYNELTLVKLFMFPIFVSIFKLAHIPYLICIDIIYILASLVLTMSLRKLIKNDYLILLLFIILIFNPISYAKETYLLFYRNGFNISMILFFFGTLISYYFNSNKKNSIFLGITFFLMLMTREDYIWIIPAFIFIIVIVKTKIINKIIPIIVILSLVLTVSFTNYLYYKAFTVNELSSSQFKKTYDKIMSLSHIDKKNEDTLSRLKLASINSPTFLEIYNKMKKYGVLNSKNFDGGNVLWSMRQASGELGYFKDYKTSSKLFKKIETELDKAYKDGKLTYSHSVKLTVTAPPMLSSLMKIPKDTLMVLPTILGYKDVKIEDGYNKYEDSMYSNFKDITNQNISPTNMYLDDAKFIKVMCLDAILQFYQRVWILLSILGITSYIYLIIKKEKVIIESTILFSTVLFIMGVVYTNISSFYTLKYYYLAPSYVLLTVFLILCIMRASLILKHKKLS